MMRALPALALALAAAVPPPAEADAFGAALGRIVGTVNGAPAEWTIRERANLLTESVADEWHPGGLSVRLVALPEVPGAAPPESVLLVDLHVAVDPETREHLGHSSAFVDVGSLDHLVVDRAYRAANPLDPFAIGRWEPRDGRILLAATVERRLEPQDNAFAASVIEAPGDLELFLEIEADLPFAPYDG